MVVIKPGKLSTSGEFYFICKKCGCKWCADRGDKGFHISPPCVKFYAYMDCPSCGETTFDR